MEADRAFPRSTDTCQHPRGHGRATRPGWHESRRIGTPTCLSRTSPATSTLNSARTTTRYSAARTSKASPTATLVTTTPSFPDDPNYQPRDTSARIGQMLREDKPRRRTQTLFPYLMIRACREIAVLVRCGSRRSAGKAAIFT